MKSFREWSLREQFEDPDWGRLKSVWGGGTKHVDNNMVNKMKLKIHGITDQYIKELNDPKITNFRELPPNMRDSLAQSLVVATLKAFYAEVGSDATGGRGVLDTKKLGGFQQNTQPPKPQDDMTAPSGWKG